MFKSKIHIAFIIIFFLTRFLFFAQTGQYHWEAKTKPQKVTILGYITTVGIEESGNYRLVIETLSGNTTLTAEVSNPSSPEPEKYPGYKSKCEKIRQTIDDSLGVPKYSMTPLNTRRKVKLTGYISSWKRTRERVPVDIDAVYDLKMYPVLGIKFLD